MKLTNCHHSQNHEIKLVRYLFIFEDGHCFDTIDAVTFREAIERLIIYTHCDNSMFQKCILGFEEDDVEGLIKFYNYISDIECQIKSVYDVNSLIGGNV